jgi:hypothetical protein
MDAKLVVQRCLLEKLTKLSLEDLAVIKWLDLERKAKS